MTIIYNNIAAIGAPIFDHVLTGCENKIMFRADNWGTTQVQVDSYSVSDGTFKPFNIFTVGAANTNFQFPTDSLSIGEGYRFTVLTPDAITTQLFVEIIEGACCCSPPTTNTCFKIPIEFVPCVPCQ